MVSSAGEFMECVEENMLLKFATGQLAGSEAANVEAHVDECPACRAAVAAALHSTDVGAGRGRASVDSSGPAPGTTVDRYVVLQLVGSGGMGQVFAAYDPQLDRKIALKFVRAEPDHEHAAALRTRLLREARAMARLTHPNVVTVFDAGAYGDDVFIAMEFVDGTTARKWVQRSRGWREVLGMYLQAGRGLAAAHAAGLVHRDFKPENVLIASDGTVRVTDFGLVKRAGGETDDVPLEIRETADAHRPFDATLTEAGTYMGTVGYMAPEALRGEPTDARADQFSFCAAAYEALYGDFLFPSTSFAAYRAAVLEGQVMPPPSGTRVPARIRRALVRGLSPRPEDRFPSLDALLRELERETRVAIAVASVTAAALVIAAGGWVWMAPTAQERCAAAGAPVTSTWTSQRRETIRRAFEATGSPQARDAWAGAERTLDAWARDWSAQAVSTCRARSENPSSALVVREQACLEGASDEFGTLLQLLETPDPKLVSSAISAAFALPLPRQCANAQRLGSLPVPVDGASARERTRHLQSQLAEARATRYAGRYADALGKAKAVVASARAAGDRSVLAEALWETGALQDYTADFKGAVASFEEADVLAEALGFDWLRTKIAVELVYANYLLEDAGAAHRWAALTRARLERMGGDDGMRAKVLRYEGEVLVQEGRREEGVAIQREGLAVARTVYGDGDPLVLSTTIELANALDGMGEFDEALTLAERGFEGRVRLFGGESPQANFARSVLAYILLDVGDYDRAQLLAHEQVDIAERVYGPDHFRVADACGNLATALLAEGDVERALELYARAHELYARSQGPDSYYAASALTDVARAELAKGNPQKAAALARESLAKVEKNKMGEEAAREAAREPLLLLADVAMELGQPREAMGLYRRTLESEEHVGARNLRVAVPLTGIGEAALALGDLPVAIDSLERVVKLREGHRVPSEDVGRTKFALARALWARGGGDDRQRAAELARQAREAFVAGAKREGSNVGTIDAWLEGTGR